MKQNFVANPGLFWLFHDKQATDTVGLWAGNGTLDTGQKVRVQALAINESKDNGGKRYEFKVLNVDKKHGEMWEHLDSFQMPAFGKTSSGHVVNTKLGKLRVWRQMPVIKPDGRKVAACIRMRILRSTNGDSTAPAPI